MSDQAIALALSDHHAQEKLKEAFRNLSERTTDTGKLLNSTRPDLLKCGGHFCERNDGNIDADTISKRFAEGTLEQPGQKRIEFQFALHRKVDSRICCPVISPVIAKAVQEMVTVQSDPSCDDLIRTTVRTTTVELWCMDPPAPSRSTDCGVFYYLSAHSTEVRQAYRGGSTSRYTTEEATGYVNNLDKFNQVLEHFVGIASTPSF